MTSQKKDKSGAPKSGSPNSGAPKSTVSNDKLYEGLICLDVKLSKLIDIMDKLYQIAEQKQTGGSNTLTNSQKKV